LREVTKVTTHDMMIPGHPREGADADPVVRQAGSSTNEQTARGVTHGAITNI